MGGGSSKEQKNINTFNNTVVEVDINKRFDNQIGSIQQEINKLEFKFEEYKSLVQKMKEENNPQNTESDEIAGIEKKGLETYEFHMKVLLKIDEFVGLEETRRIKRKELVVQVQSRLDVIEELECTVKQFKQNKVGIKKSNEE